MWNKTKLKDLCAQVVDCPHSTPVWTKAGVIVLRNQNIRQGRLDLSAPSFTDERHYLQRVRRAVPQVGDLVITREAPMGEVCMIPADIRCCLGQRMVLLRPDQKKCDGRFLLYALQSPRVQHEISVSEGTGSTVSNLRIPLLEALPIEHPDPPEQRAIAHILGTLDDKIELNRKMNQTLDEIARTLFTSWFVTFDPVRAKAEGRQPEGMDAETAALFPERFVDSELGPIPEGWTIKSVIDFAEMNSWSLSQNEALDPIKYIEISEVKKGEIGNISCFERGTEPSRARHCLRHGDTVLSMVRPDRGAYFLCLNPDHNLIASTGFAVLTPRNAPWSFVHGVVTRSEVFSHLGLLADGGAYPAIRPEVIGALQVAMPPTSLIIERFAQIAEPLLNRAHANRIESRTLAAMRDMLLPELLSGRIQVPVAEQMVGAAVS